MNPEFADGLDAFLKTTGTAREDYTVEKTLKESEAECTELVRDAQGRLWIRKHFFRDDPAIEDSYRAIRDAGSPDLPRIHELYRMAAGTEVVREYFPGPTLREWVESYGPLDESSARDALLQVCRSVRALHVCKPPLIHRDINPSNVIVTLRGPQLIDFGIARAYDANASRDTHAWGTTGYAAPEQFGFDQSDARTDVFALGMLYCFMLTGSDPEANLGARLRQGDSGISQEASDVIQKCVALAPEARFQTVDALIDALGDAGMDRPVPERAESPLPAGHDDPSFVRKVASKAWIVIATGFMAVIVLAIIGTLAEPWRLSVPEGWAHAAVFCLGMLVAFAPAWLLTTNVFGIRERLPFLKRHVAIRCAAIIVVSFLVGVLIANAASQNLPEAYLQLMQQHDVNTI